MFPLAHLNPDPGKVMCRACGERKPREAFPSNGLRIVVTCARCLASLAKSAKEAK